MVHNQDKWRLRSNTTSCEREWERTDIALLEFLSQILFGRENIWTFTNVGKKTVCEDGFDHGEKGKHNEISGRLRLRKHLCLFSNYQIVDVDFLPFLLLWIEEDEDPFSQSVLLLLFVHELEKLGFSLLRKWNVKEDNKRSFLSVWGGLKWSDCMQRESEKTRDRKRGKMRCTFW